ncbi:MAG: LUD domain-containing protein [Tannerellaceae bacterium]|jgi:L-lactate dehydrogenase complex protein LldG|nr:LUD domain-containing protein [Tannerellaceae bacterium]
MSSKDDILNRIRQQLNTPFPMPELSLDGISYPDPVGRFEESVRSVGGEVIRLQGEPNQYIRELYPDARSIASNLPEISLATLNPDEIETPYALNGTDLAIVRGTFGVAENGCVWIPQNVKEKALYFVSEYLIILLDADQIVSNMHEAYRRIHFNDYGFGVFISGPSKTADIEQSLVVGAHGAKGLTIFLQYP